MQIGLSLGGVALSFREQVGVARLAESNGFDAVTAGDMGNETFALMGALAMATTRVRLISTIASWTRSPATMANSAATVADLSGERFSLGLGPSPQQWIEGWHGQDYKPLVPRFADYVRAVRACLAADAAHPTDYQGAFHSSHGFTNWDLPRFGIPVFTAATQRRMTELAGEVADGVVLNVIHPREWIASKGREFIHAGQQKAGRAGAPFEIGVGRFVSIADDRATAYDTARAQLALYFRVPYFRALLEPIGFEEEMSVGEAAYRSGDFAGAAAAISDRMVDGIALVGTEDDVRGKLREYEGVVDWVTLYAGLEGDVERTAANTRALAGLRFGD